MVELHAVKLDRMINQDILKCLGSFISIERRQCLQQYLKINEAYRSIVAELLIRMTLCHKLNLPNNLISFKVDTHGKPYLINNRTIHFNSAHSNEWVVCALDTTPVGIDIELVVPIDYDAIAQQFFSKEEYQDIYSKEPQQRLSYFYDLWTLKESYIKATGKGLLMPLNSFSLRIVGNIFRLVKEKISRPYYFYQYDIDRSYKMAVCATNIDPPTAVSVIEINEFYQEVTKLK